MPVTLRDETTPEGKRIWENVVIAAQRCPEWIKPHVLAAAKTAREKIERIATEQARVMDLTDEQGK